MRHPQVGALLLPTALTACSADPSPTAEASPSSSPAASPSSSPTLTSAASPSMAPSPSASTARTPAASRRPAAVTMTEDGVEVDAQVLLFGRGPGEVVPRLTAALGAPTKDTGVVTAFDSDYGVCPGEDLRVLEWGGAALEVCFRTKDGATKQAFYAWRLLDDGPGPRARALVGDSATLSFGPGTTVAELEQGAGEQVDVTSDETFGDTFRLMDQSSGFYGQLASAAPAGVVTTVQGGEGCGE